MPDTTRCPQSCQALTRLGKHRVCPEHGALAVPFDVPPSGGTGPFRIFLRYGHDSNEEPVRIIKADLESRGHDVWFDKDDIQPGNNWRRSITDGITCCDNFLSFLSKHSTRDPGVCRDEIETLAKHLNPILSDARIYDLLKKGFFGRQWLFDSVEQWRTGSSDTACEQP